MKYVMMKTFNLSHFGGFFRFCLGKAVKFLQVLGKAFLRFFCYCKGKKYILAGISGLAVSLTMAVPQLFLLTWISLVPLFYALFGTRQGVKECFKITLVYGLCYYLTLYTWFYGLYPLDWLGVDNVKSFFIITFIWLGISTVQGLQTSLAGIFYGLIKPKKIYRILSIPCIWVVLEWLQTITIWGMPWGRLANSQYLFLPAIQGASLFGALFISFLIALVNAIIAYALKLDKAAFLEVKDYLKSKRVLFLAAAAVFVLNAAFGLARLISVNGRDYGKTVKIAAIQGNLPSDEKWENEGANAFDVFMDMSREAAQAGAKIIVWPETAVPVYLSEGNHYDKAYEDFAADNGVYLVAGGFREIDGKNYSTLALYTPEGGSDLDGAYLKRHLVPFGEYMPYREILEKVLPFLADFSMLGEDASASDKSIVFNTEYGKMSGLICFDSIFPQYAAEDAKNGSELIIMGTNDSYYINTLNPYQHRGQAVLRAVENNRFLVRSANTGVSCVISPSGNILAEKGILKTDILYYDVPFIEAKTPYTLTGDIIVIFSAAFTAYVFIRGRIFKK